MAKTVGLIGLGCAKNRVDGEVMLGLLQQAGYEVAVDPEQADTIIIHTCGFIGDAKEESIDTILEAAEWRKQGKRLVVTGCLVQRYAQHLLKEIPEIDALMGTADLHRIVEVCDTVTAAPPAPTRRQAPRRRPVEPKVWLGDPPYLYDADTPRLLSTPSHYAYVKVAEGCSYRCSFCSIPAMRGDQRSRSIESIVQEAKNLAARGVKELILISQNTTAYGRDLYGKPSLPSLLHALAAVEGVEWIRFLYAYPADVRDDVIAAMAAEPKVCNYLEMPLQHCDTRVLKAMNRGGTRAELEELITKLRHRVPGLTLRTTFIVGFPGETAEAFRALESFVEWARFERMGAFTYSQEEGTPAGAMSGQIAPRIKEHRRHRLMERQRDISWAYHQTLIGQRLRVLIDGFSDAEQMWEGRYEGQAPEIDGVVYVRGGHLIPGTFVQVEVTEATEYDLIGRPVEAS
ncbi:MAG TPA: 30S ribosomal protein S12 methylthiotransferase RimO [Candidatus Tectomicrobia bacterium]|nr:30S ribosomal protein S12 methylthiotransferase RimO [Candidatus Tectomicrobia bacterium]